MQPCKYKHWINFPSASKGGEVKGFPMKIYKCFKRLSITTWACAGYFLNTTYADRKNNLCVTYPELLYSDHSLKLVSAEGGVGHEQVGRRAERSEARGLFLAGG